MARAAALPILTGEPGLTHYFEEIRRFPMLERQEEYMLAKRWREHGDRDAAHKLVTSHLRLVTYGLPISGGDSHASRRPCGAYSRLAHCSRCAQLRYGDLLPLFALDPRRPHPRQCGDSGPGRFRLRR